jgi:hypothetical protein
MENTVSTLSVGVRMVEVHAAVLDKHGRHVPHLTLDRFESLKPRLSRVRTEPHLNPNLKNSRESENHSNSCGGPDEQTT